MLTTTMESTRTLAEVHPHFDTHFYTTFLHMAGYGLGEHTLFAAHDWSHLDMNALMRQIQSRVELVRDLGGRQLIIKLRSQVDAAAVAAPSSIFAGKLPGNTQ